MKKVIVHQRTCPYTLKKSSEKRNHIHILEVTRALKFQGQILLKFWS